MDQVTITYYGHACFLLEYQGYRVALDPYTGVPGMPELHMEAETVYCSHQHGDHNYIQAVRLQETEKPVPYTLETMEVPHDDAGGVKRGMNTVHIFHFGGLSVAHMGDIGRTLTDEEVKILSGVDCILIPVGGFFTIDASQAKTVVEQVKPSVTIPMHYRTGLAGLPVISTVERFTGQFDHINKVGSSLVLTKDTPEGIYVLTIKK